MSAYHPEADGQTERTNQTIEAYIRMYCNFQQDDWADWLPLAEFAYNNSPSASTEITPFFANKGYHPNMGVDASKLVASSNAKHFAAKLDKVHQYLREVLTHVRDRMKKSADKGRLPHPEYKVGDEVFVLAKFIKTTRPTTKFSEKYYGPFKITAHPSRNAYTLRLNSSLKGVHPTFHVSQLEPHTPNPFPSRTQDPPEAEVIDKRKHYELDEVVDSKLDDRRTYCKILYLVCWTGWQDTGSALEWVLAEDMWETAKEAIAEFHARYPTKPGPWTPPTISEEPPTE
jgi:hypothetical protein